MAQMVIRNLDDEVKVFLKQQAARHGWSMEKEARQILCNALGGGNRGLPAQLGDRKLPHVFRPWDSNGNYRSFMGRRLRRWDWMSDRSGHQRALCLDAGAT